MEQNLPAGEPGLGEFLWDGSQGTRELLIPCHEMLKPQFEQLRQRLNVGEILMGNLYSYDPNPWYLFLLPTTPIMILVAIFIPGIMAFNIGLAIHHLVNVVRLRGHQNSVVQIFLWMEILANFLRFFQGAVDPLWSRKTLPFLPGQILLTISFPIELMATLMIALFWAETLEQTRVKPPIFIHKMRIPFWITFIILFIFEAVTATLRGAYRPISALTTLSGALYAIVSAVVSFLFLFFAVKVLRRIAKSTKKLNTKRSYSSTQNKMTRMARSAVGIGISTLILIGLMLIVAFTDSIYQPLGWVTIWPAITISLGFRSAVQIHLFSVAKQAKDNKTSSFVSASGTSLTGRTSGSRTV